MPTQSKEKKGEMAVSMIHTLNVFEEDKNNLNRNSNLGLKPTIKFNNARNGNYESMDFT
jgi:hypothetical protein